MKIKLLSSCVIIVLLSSCAIHHGNYMPTSFNSQNIKNQALSQVSVSYFLGFGGLGKDAMVLEAKKRLFENFPLAKGEAYANFTLDYKTVYYPLFVRKKLTLAADIIDLENTAPQAPANNKDAENEGNSIFKSQQEVYFQDGGVYTVARIVAISRNKITVQYSDENRVSFIKSVSNSQVFLKADGASIYQNIKVGGTQPVNVYYLEKKQVIMADIIGVGINKFLIRYKSGEREMTEELAY